jgi:flagellar basal body-associated protein FliL
MGGEMINKKQTIVMILLITAIVLSLASIFITVSFATSFPEFKIINNASSGSGSSQASIGLTVTKPPEDENEIR